VTGNPSPASPAVRTLDRDVGSLTASNPYTGTTQNIANYLADPTEEAILHMVNADPARTPTLAMFARPDYFLSPGSASCAPCVTQNTSFAWDHGDYAAEINTNYAGLVGPGVASGGLDGSPPAAGPGSAGPNSGQTTVPDSGTTGTWADETDIRPTIMSLVGLHDDYKPDGRVISQVLAKPSHTISSPTVQALGDCYKQLNSSVGEFGTSTLKASTRGLESTSPDDRVYTNTEATLSLLDRIRDVVAGKIKNSLDAAEFSGVPVRDARGQLAACDGVIAAARFVGTAEIGHWSASWRAYVDRIAAAVRNR
jgi:hypothetical protein